MIENLRPGASASNARVALFDFDGTISVIRSGWMEIMIPMMVEILMDLKTGEREEDLRAVVEEFVGRLTGKQTMYQMIALAEEIEKRGGTPLDPLEYKNQYLALLNDRIHDTIVELRAGRCSPEKYLVPGARALLEALNERGLKMYLASGTDQIYMREEARLLDVDRYFDGGVFGALDDYKSFSKKILIQGLIGCTEFKRRSVPGLRRRLRGNRKHQGSGRCGGQNAEGSFRAAPPLEERARDCCALRRCRA